MSQGPGLELLIRKKGPDGGMELRTVDSAAAFLRLRPKPVPGVEENVIEEATGTVHVLKLPDGLAALRLTPPQHHVWQQMDGKRTIQELAADWFLTFGSFDFDEIRTVLTRARRLGLVQVATRPRGLLQIRRMVPVRRLDRVLERLAAVDLRWEDVDRHFARLDRVAGWVLSRWLLPLHVVVVGLGLGAWLTHRGTDRFGAADPGPLAWLAGVALSLAVAVPLHELLHGLATRHVGRRVKAVGFTLVDRFVPTVYVDVTDTWLSSRLERVAVVLAGPAANLVLAGLAALGAAAAAGPGASWALMVFADANLILACYAAWPFTGLPEDGFVAWSEAVRVPYVRRQAARRVRALVGASGDEAGAGPAVSRAVAVAVWGWVAGVALTWIVGLWLAVRALASWLG